VTEIAVRLEDVEGLPAAFVGESGTVDKSDGLSLHGMDNVEAEAEAEAGD
jgi:hypothetical protein